MINCKVIEDILIDEDPERLIAMGCPKNEYSLEAQIIYDMLNGDDADWHIDAIRFVVAAVFQQTFGSSVKLRWNHDNKAIINIAERIYAII